MPVFHRVTAQLENEQTKNVFCLALFVKLFYTLLTRITTIKSKRRDLSIIKPQAMVYRY